MNMKIMEYLDRTGTHLTEKCWNTFGNDISDLKFTPEEWKEKITQMEQFCNGGYRK